jgi:hypothetical protein
MELSKICTRHRTDLNIQDKIIELIKEFSDGKVLPFSSHNHQNRLAFVNKSGKKFQTDELKHEDVVVSLATSGSATVGVFNLEAMIMSLLLDKSIMHLDNISYGYDLLTGKSVGPNDHYRENHMGDT